MLTTIALKIGQINAFTLMNFLKTCITDCLAKKTKKNNDEDMQTQCTDILKILCLCVRF